MLWQRRVRIRIEWSPLLLLSSGLTGRAAMVRDAIVASARRCIVARIQHCPHCIVKILSLPDRWSPTITRRAARHADVCHEVASSLGCA